MPENNPGPGNRLMRPDDVGGFAELFLRTFSRRKSKLHPDLLSYIQRVLFGSPIHSPGAAGVLRQDAQGSVQAAVGATAMRIAACGRTYDGRLTFALMADPQAPAAGARLAMSLRARHVDFQFSDTAAPVSAEIVKGAGGIILPVQSLDWRCIFRPLAVGAGMAARRLHPTLERAAKPMMALPDAVMRQASRRYVFPPNPNAVMGDLSDQALLDAAPRMVERFAIHPEWSAAELSWLLNMAREKQHLGRLELGGVRTPQGQLIGCVVYYAGRNRSATVLNILSEQGKESDVIGAMLHHFDAQGFVSAKGMAQPSQMEALCRQYGIAFGPRGFFWIMSRHDDVCDAARRGDIYLGGLAGEIWSRLLDDFV
jgi:hypothetical protein